MFALIYVTLRQISKNTPQTRSP